MIFLASSFLSQQSSDKRARSFFSRFSLVRFARSRCSLDFRSLSAQITLLVRSMCSLIVLVLMKRCCLFRLAISSKRERLFSSRCLASFFSIRLVCRFARSTASRESHPRLSVVDRHKVRLISLFLSRKKQTWLCCVLFSISRSFLCVLSLFLQLAHLDLFFGFMLCDNTGSVLSVISFLTDMLSCERTRLSRTLERRFGRSLFSRSLVLDQKNDSVRSSRILFLARFGHWLCECLDSV